MLDADRMAESCRICGRQLCGNRRRWIFHPASRLRVLLAHALGRGPDRAGPGRAGGRQFACSKCAFMLERMFRFDAVAARVAALSLARLQRLLREKRRLRLCVAALYRRSNARDAGAAAAAGPDRSYADLIRDDLLLSGFESWAADRQDAAPPPVRRAGPKNRRCRGCAALRVADSDYDAVCKVPRRFGRRSASCGPPTRHSDPDRTSEADRRSHSPGSSVESLDPDPDQDPDQAGPVWRKPQTGWQYRPVTPPRGSKIPVLVQGKLDPNPAVPDPDPDPDQDPVLLSPEEELQAELEELQELWVEDYLQCGPVRQVEPEPEPD